SFADNIASFVDRYSELLPPARRVLYDRLLEASPRLLRRVLDRRNLTILHGDAHVWNVFLPKDGGGDVRLFDFDAWRLGLAAADLSSARAMHWYPERRAGLEQPLLDRYHAALLAAGVAGYDRAALADDYRLSVLYQLSRPVWQAVNNLPPVIWWNNLERIML